MTDEAETAALRAEVTALEAKSAEARKAVQAVTGLLAEAIDELDRHDKPEHQHRETAAHPGGMCTLSRAGAQTKLRGVQVLLERLGK
jgi:hypothetical protein